MKTLVPEQILGAIHRIVGTPGVKSQSADMARHLVEPRGLYHGQSPLVVSPTTVAEVRAVVELCHGAGVAIVPQGGNTGLCGAAIPSEAGGEIVMSLDRLNRVREIDPLNYTITVEAGCILAHVQQAAGEADRLFPLSLGAEGSCQIGGNLSTNAGGINTLRYGNMRDLVLGLEVVLPDGQLWDGLRRLRKDNTGYDLKQLFIGAEGTLGVVTAAVLKLFPKPREEVTAIVAVATLTGVIELLSRLRLASGDQVTAFELLPRFGIDISLLYVPGVRDPFATRHEHYALMRLSAGRANSGLRDIVEETLGQAMTEGLVLDAVMAENESQVRDFWRIREAIVEAQIPAGGSIKHDVAVPVSRVAEFIERANVAVEALIPGARPCPFGHVGDGNVHYNVTQPTDMDKQAFLDRWAELNAVVHAIVRSLNGSISAEHGLGRLKVDEITHYKSALELDLMRQLKRTLDPKGIMNPGKVVRV
ncbi:MAG: FAD-binding oxidoreductase [Alphaproteobacteria bacterium]|nr:FAD-binding oxidoreductase [Alphaproteobacteria bacterium]